jgi:hypothetical protein
MIETENRLKLLLMALTPIIRRFCCATVALIQQLAAVYVEEDLLAGAENLHGSQTTETKKIEEVVKVM